MIVLKEGALDDYIPSVHSEYFEKVVAFLKKSGIPLKVNGTDPGGWICWIDLKVGVKAVFKHPNTKLYIPFRYMEVNSEGDDYLSSKMFGANGWYYKHVPIEEIWVCINNKYKNIKGKTISRRDFWKNIDFKA